MAKYFKLRISCPVCHDNGLNTPQTGWSHNGCGGALNIGDNAHYQCQSCSYDSHVKNWKYGCPSHSDSSGEIVYKKSSAQGLAAAVSTAGQMVRETGVAWLQTFLGNMGDF